MHQDSVALLQLLLAISETRTLNRIIQCPTYPIKIATSDLPERVRLFREIISADPRETPNLLRILYESAVTTDHRKSRGQYFTPTNLARLAAKRLRYQDGMVVLDPGCGTGAFAAAMLGEFGRRSEDLTYLGIEMDPILAISTAICLDSLNAPKKWRILYANFLLLDPEYLKKLGFRTIDAIICNPPFVRFHRIRGRKRLAARIRHRAGLHLTGLSGLHSFFLAQAQSLLSKKGMMTFLLPLEMDYVNHGLGLLNQLSQRFSYESETISPDLMVYTFAPREEGKGFAPIRYEDTKPQLRSIGAVHRGISTGANEFFVLTDPKARELGIDPSFLSKAIPPRIPLPNEIVTQKDWNYWSDSGKPCWLLTIPAELQESRLSKNLKEYLRYGERIGVHQVYTCKNRHPWYSVPLSPIPDFLFTYMSRARPRFIFNEVRAHILTNLLGLHLTFKNKESSEMPVIARMLSQSLSMWIESSSVGRRYAGGLLKFEPGDLFKMPITEGILSKLRSPSLSGFAQHML